MFKHFTDKYNNEFEVFRNNHFTDYEKESESVKEAIKSKNVKTRAMISMENEDMMEPRINYEQFQIKKKEEALEVQKKEEEKVKAKEEK